MNKPTGRNVPLWKLRRVAERAVEVQQRHRGAAAALRQFDRTLQSKVTRFVQAYDAARARSPALHGALGEEAVRELRTTMRSWLGPIARDIDGFTAQSFDDRALVPDDVIGSAQRLLGVVRTFKLDGQPLPYVADVEESLGPAIEAASARWDEGQELLAAHQALLGETRAAAALLHKELIALRRSLRAVIGMQHRDYRMLRTARSAAVSDDADDAEEVAEEVAQQSGETEGPVQLTLLAPPRSSAPVMRAVTIGAPASPPATSSA